VVDSTPIIFQSLGTGRLTADRGHREVTDFHSLRRGEEEHVDRIVIERIAKTAFVDDQGAHPGALRFNGAGKARRPRTDANDVVVKVSAHKIWYKTPLAICPRARDADMSIRNGRSDGVNNKPCG
jgi:hypothetical protein